MQFKKRLIKKKSKGWMSDILDRIHKKNIEKYGEICSNCSTHQKYCRCESYEMKKADKLRSKEHSDSIESITTCPHNVWREFESGYKQCVDCKEIVKK